MSLNTVKSQLIIEAPHARVLFQNMYVVLYELFISYLFIITHLSHQDVHTYIDTDSLVSWNIKCTHNSIIWTLRMSHILKFKVFTICTHVEISISN